MVRPSWSGVESAASAFARSCSISSSTWRSCRRRVRSSRRCAGWRCEDLRVVDGHRDVAHPQLFAARGQFEDLREDIGEQRTVLPAERAAGVVVGVRVGVEVAHRHFVEGALLDAAAGEGAGGVAVTSRASIVAGGYCSLPLPCSLNLARRRSTCSTASMMKCTRWSRGT